MVIAFHALAERELNDAADYYDREQPGLGAAFIADVKRCTDAIFEYPEAGPIIWGGVRRRMCRKFRYGVLYTIRPGTIRVLAVMNLRAIPRTGLVVHDQAAQQGAAPDGRRCDRERPLVSAHVSRTRSSQQVARFHEQE